MLLKCELMLLQSKINKKIRKHYFKKFIIKIIETKYEYFNNLS